MLTLLFAVGQKVGAVTQGAREQACSARNCDARLAFGGTVIHARVLTVPLAKQKPLRPA